MKRSDEKAVGTVVDNSCWSSEDEWANNQDAADPLGIMPKSRRRLDFLFGSVIGGLGPFIFFKY